MLFLGSLFSQLAALSKDQFADRSFYLVDSLTLTALEEVDRRLIDSILPLYHEAQTNDVRLGLLNHLTENCWDDAIWPMYNDHMLRQTNWLLGRTEGEADTVRNVFLKYKAIAINNKGYFHINRGERELALKYYQKSLAIDRDIRQREGVATTLNNIGFIYYNSGEMERALEYWHQSLSIQEEIDDQAGIARSLNNIGAVYKIQDDLEEALGYHEKSLAIKKDIGDKKGEAESYVNIGVIYGIRSDNAKVDSVKQRWLARSTDHYYMSLRLETELGHKEGIAFSLNHLGMNLERQGDLDDALDHYKRSLAIREEISDKRGKVQVLTNMGMVYTEQGLHREAIAVGNRAVKLAAELGYPESISKASRLLWEAHKQTRVYKLALHHFEVYINMRDSIKNEQTQKAAIRQQTKYGFEKAQLVKEQKELEAARLKADLLSRRDNLQYSIILIGILVVFGGILSLGFLNVSSAMVEGLIFFAFLIFFEFLLVLADPYVDGWTGGAPGWKLLINAGIAALVFPIHSFFEKVLTRRVIV